MSATIRRLAWDIAIADSARWTDAHRAAAKADLKVDTYDDWVVAELVERMAGAAEAFIWNNPDLFVGSLA